ncbi:MAG: hypothetical protein ACK4U0_19020 [Mesorhizobium sp.]
MDWRREDDMLEAILSLLVSFAALADRAAGLPLCLQLPALGFLMQGEAVARSFLVDLPFGAPALVVASNATDRAERLAADFHALARLLRILLARARRRARCADREAVRPAGSSATPLRLASAGRRVGALPAPDTS